MRGLITWGLKQRRWFMIWWMVGIFALIFVNLIFYPSFRDQTAELEKTFSQLPDSVSSLISDTGDIFSPSGYLSSQVFYLLLPMMLGILSISLGASLIGREENDGTIELLLSRPISRTTLLRSKALIGIVIVVGVGLFGTITTVVMSTLVKLDVPSMNIFLTGLAAILLAVCFGAMALMITTLGRGARVASIAVAALFAFGGYILASLKSNVEWLKWPSKVFPFDYYHPGDILNGTFNWQNLWYMVGFLVLSAAISVVSFRRRDLKS